ncbi:GNAT family N-acetyltransferase [Rossellomorea aquimaris]|uniref:GNAT family N-acetyltransferase n=1 Tax=Rossellomorea aquimaris TaxID=189382 RepID=UPI001CD57FEE|nr:GNAT family N-acetyltransferase [Rossellomorea aquimaris]MCA1054021.1 GNAT family N-acetyltransferase [Rossellomorea aquimaris]
MDVEIIRDYNREDLIEMQEVYQSVGWKKHTEDIINQVFSASNIKVLVKLDGRIVGFGRAISDGVFNAAIYDLVVHHDYQKKGIAKRILDEMLIELSSVSCVHLISTTGNEEFYRKHGFRKVKTGMARYLRWELANEYLE